MNKPILSICIPTYNRVNYLKELLPDFIREILSADQENSNDIELLISDNASTDSTRDYIQSIGIPWLHYYRNDENIGGDCNFLVCIERATGGYVWLFGDDELIVKEGIVRLLKVLRCEKPDLVILDGDDSEPRMYPDYVTCLVDKMKKQPVFPLMHTLITANVFKKELFDLPYARLRLKTNYSHMFGFVKNLSQQGKVVVLGAIMTIRTQRAQFNKWPFALCVKQGIYLFCLANWTGVRSLYMQALRLCLNLPVEILSCFLHRFFPRIFGRT